jgi:four helix bundle protein
MMVPYQKFKAWEAAHNFALEIYRITDEWPDSERYQLSTQIRRAALSVPTNIAEGAAKKGPREFRRYLDIARGSLGEVSYLLLFSKDRGLLTLDVYRSLEEMRNTTGKIMWGLYISLVPNQT